MTDRAEILRLARQGKAPTQIARETRQPIEYVRNMIDALRQAGLLPGDAEW